MSRELESLLDRFRLEGGSPVVEGRRCTFLVRVRADEVFVRHRVIEWPAELAMSRVGTDLWWLEQELEPGARVEYQFERRLGRGWERFNDPGNPRLARSPVGDSSVAWGSDYRPPHWALPDPTVPSGTLEELSLWSQAQGRVNRVTVYRPYGSGGSGGSGVAAVPMPLLVVHDGGDFLAYASMATVLDNLIAARDIPPVVVAFTHPGERLTEYPDDYRHAAWITTELLRELRSRYSVGSASLMGASFGAVAALSTAACSPDVYAGLLLQSGSFVFTEGGEPHREDASFDPVVRFVDAYRARPRRVCDRLFLSCGRYEDLVVHDRAMVPVFEQTGMAVRYVESLDGHNWESWRDRLRDGLTWLFPAAF